jgi:hypothetical protein
VPIEQIAFAVQEKTMCPEDPTESGTGTANHKENEVCFVFSFFSKKYAGWLLMYGRKERNREAMRALTSEWHGR